MRNIKKFKTMESRYTQGIWQIKHLSNIQADVTMNTIVSSRYGDGLHKINEWLMYLHTKKMWLALMGVSNFFAGTMRKLWYKTIPCKSIFSQKAKTEDKWPSLAQHSQFVVRPNAGKIIPFLVSAKDSCDPARLKLCF